MKAKRIVSICLAALTLIVCICVPALAANDEVPYSSFNFDKWGNAVSAPNGYLPSREIKGSHLGIGEFKAPADMFYYKQGREIYIADSGNNRIVVLNEDGNVLRVMEQFKNKEEEYLLKNPTGIFVDEGGTVYICDQGNAQVIMCDKKGNIERIIGKPKSELIIKDFEYRPSKIVVDKYGKIYVQAVGVFEGIFCLSPQGEFINFYGANHVTLTFKLRVQQLWNMVRTKEQRDGSQSAVPIEYSNLYIDDANFVYATVVTASETETQLQDTKQDVYKANKRELITKLNPLGVNLMKKMNMSWFQYAALTDVFVDANGVITMCDKELGIIYQCDKNGKLMFAFGGKGDQLGLFRDPSALLEVNNSLFVMDSAKNNITVFQPTEFGELVHNAMQLYNEGRYHEDIQPWEQVLRSDANYLLAYTGLGKAYFQLEQYDKAMQFYRLANDRGAYSDAFKEYSLVIIRQNFAWIFIVIIALVMLLIAWPSIIKRYARGVPAKLSYAQRSFGYTNCRNLKNDMKYCFFAIRHPMVGFDGVKWSNKGSIAVSWLILFLFFVVQVMQTQLTGFIFNPNNPDKLSVLSIFATTIGGFLVFYFACTAVGNLMPSEAHNHQIFITGAYALFPYIIFTAARVCFSNFANQQTGVFLTFLSVIGVGWAVAILLIGMLQINQMRFGQTIMMLVLTVVGMLLALFVIFILYSLFQQFYTFFYTIFSEMMFRL